MAKSIRVRINKTQLKHLVKSELQSLQEARVDHEGISSVVTVSSKLLKALEVFEKSATPAMINALTPSLPRIKDQLDSIINNPVSYLNQPAKKIIQLRQQSSTD